jgi:hypothetical protein
MRPMAAGFDPRIALLSGGGVAAGLLLLWRGMGGYRLAAQIGGTASSRINSVAVGEVRIAGTIEGAELELTSPILRHQCVYFRASVYDTRGNDRRKVFSDERSVGFRVRDASGAIRVFPRGARWDVPAIDTEGMGFIGGGGGGIDLPVGVLDAGGGGSSYEEARLEVGDPVTIIGTVLPFDQLPDPLGADEDTLMADPGGGEDPEVAADIAEARAAGLLTGDPDDAWGNAAIPGFGIGQPVRPPELDPAAHPEPLATAEQAEAAKRQFDIEPRSLVIAVGPDAPMLVAAGLPATAESRNSTQFIIGLGGALLAIASAVALAFVVTGGFR